MLLMIVGLLVFFAIHLVPTSPDVRRSLVERMGEGGYKAMFSLVTGKAGLEVSAKGSGVFSIGLIDEVKKVPGVKVAAPVLDRAGDVLGTRRGLCDSLAEARAVSVFGRDRPWIQRCVCTCAQNPANLANRSEIGSGGLL